MTHQSLNCGATGRRLGFTLVELLVALTIAMVLTVVALPRVREGLQQNVASRTATLVKGAFENARANAIRTGRPYGVILHRVQNEVTPGNAIDDPLLFAAHGANYCKRISFAEVAFDYRGDVEDATATLRAAGGGFYLEFDNATAGLVWAHVNEMIPYNQRQFGLGNLVRLGPERIPATLSDLPPGVQQTQTNSYYGISTPYPLLPGRTALRVGDQLTFSIQTLPRPSALSSVELPGKIVIDLAASGPSRAPSGFAPAAIYSAAAGEPPDLRVDAAGTYIPGYRDVIVMFNETGALDGVYVDQWLGGIYLYQKFPPTDAVSLLIGEIDRVVHPLTTARFPAPRADTTWGGIDPAQYDHTARKLPNFANSSAAWLTISPSSGKVTLKQAAGPLGLAGEAAAHPELAGPHPVDVLVRNRLLDSRRLTRGTGP